MKNKMIKLVISDFDGPINDLLEAKKITLTKLCSDLEISLSKEALDHCINSIDQLYIHGHYENYKDLIYMSLQKLRQEGDVVCTSGTLNILSEKFASKLVANLCPNTLMLSALTKIKTSFPQTRICIYSNQTCEYINNFFQQNKIDSSIVDKIYGCDLFSEFKPSIKNLELICVEQGVKHENVLMIGDDPIQDLLPAKIIGMKTALFNPVVDCHISNETDLLRCVQI